MFIHRSIRRSAAVLLVVIASSLCDANVVSARAAETARIIAQHIGVADDLVVQARHLAPNDDVEDMALELESGRESLLLVGHLPHLARLTSHLLAGDSERVPVRFPDAAALVMGRVHGTWHLVAFACHEVLN